MSIPADRLRTSLRGAKLGVLGGVLGAVVMAMYAMVVSATVKDAGFFTPLYHIASVFLEPKTMMTRSTSPPVLPSSGCSCTCSPGQLPGPCSVRP